MNIAIIGFDLEGRATYEYFKREGGHQITICDQNMSVTVPDGLPAQLGDSYLDNLNVFDCIVRTPGLHPQKILNKNPGIAGKITTQTNLFFEHSPTANIIGVTGTKGKGTTSSLITTLLQAAGKTVHLGGNIGVPALQLLLDGVSTEDYVVLELSSFQLIDLKHSPHVAACLMVMPEHLNWHADLQEYYQAKQQLFRWQTGDDTAIYYAANDQSADIASAGSGAKVPYMQAPGALVEDNIISIQGQAICNIGELQLVGKHNWQNVCAALTVAWQITQDVAALRQALISFKGLEHRLELVRELSEVRYYDDSFGTTPETAVVAIEAFMEPKVIILGGSDKGASYDDLAIAVKAGNVRKALLIGDQADRIQAALDAAGFTDYQPGGDNMEEIVHMAQLISQPGDVVLLSTACASFGMFKNYKDRGDQFKAAVQSLVPVAQ